MILAFLSWAGNIQIFAQDLEANPDETVILWGGKKVLAGSHTGDVRLKSATLVMRSNKLTGGMLVVDMNSLRNTDIESEDSRKRLENHLRSDDFILKPNLLF